MRFVQYTGSGVLELNYMWLPTWLGMNVQFKKDCEGALAEKIKGLTTEDLDRINALVIDYICEKYPLPGLRDYLDGIKFVEG
jgi:hypothetical protein